MAYERGVLYGLVLYSGRRISYAKIDPLATRELFIRGALVNRDWECNLPFFVQNQKLIREIEMLEHKARRPDFLIDEELLFAFYDDALPAEICSPQTLEHWLKTPEVQKNKPLFLSKEDLLKRNVSGITAQTYPKFLNVREMELALSYHFEPGSPKDGVTLTVPLYALNQIDPAQCDWLVMGMLKDKVAHLVKTLPPRARHRLQPVPDFIAAFCEAQIENFTAPFAQTLIEALRDAVQAHTAVAVKTEDFRTEQLPAHCHMNFKVVDEAGRQLDMSRSLGELRAALGREAQQSFAAHANEQAAETLDIPDEITDWNFGELPELLEMERGGKTIVGFPALVDCQTHASLEVFDDERVAAAAHQKGLTRLFKLQLKDQVKHLEKSLKACATTAMQAQSIGLPFAGVEQLTQILIDLAFESAFLQAPLPCDDASFALRKDQGRARLNLLSMEWLRLLETVVSEASAAHKKTGQLKPYPSVLLDIQQQWQGLFPKNFTAFGFERLGHYPRYLKGIGMRVDKLRADAARDAKQMQEFAPLLQRIARATIARKGAPDPQLSEARWMAEELRVGLFAQELKTIVPVSTKRLQKLLDSAGF